ncbi:hypothetical protein [Polaromonas sp. UC242_47]|uniref:hypothetical protein n=1 Tax=Polaromonas sp. UC242_47 TaxID=3374626 RepID=UPI0037BD8884
MNKNNDLLSISALPKGQTAWRVDWFGDIAYPDRSVRRKQPSVFLHLSRVTTDRFHEDPAVLLSPDSTSPAKFQRRVWVSVGTLPMLRVGDIWRNGELEARPDYQLESFPDLEINNATVTLIKAGLNLDDQGFLLPLAEHPWHIQCTQSYCVTVDLPENRRVIIPCMELIRFYFGSSSNLISKLFLPPLERDSLYESATFDRQTARLKLELAEKVSGASAADIGRLHMDPIAWRAAAQIGASALKASVAGQSIYPQAFFPFEGKTTLLAAGKWLSFAGQEKTTFLVYNLRSCSHPFPFKSIRYEVKNSRARSVMPGGTTSELPSSRKPVGAKDAAHQSLTDKDASNSLAPKVRAIRFEPRFPDLTDKPIWKSVELTGSSKAGTGINGAPVDQVAVGNPGSERRVRPVDLAVLMSSASWEPNSVPAFLRSTVEEILTLKGFDVALLTKSTDDGWTVPVTVLADSDGEIDPRLFISDETGHSRLRRASVFAFSNGEEYICAAVIESSPIHIKLYPTIGQDPEEVWQTLKCAAVDFVSPLREEPDGLGLAQLMQWIFGLVAPEIPTLPLKQPKRR